MDVTENLISQQRKLIDLQEKLIDLQEKLIANLTEQNELKDGIIEQLKRHITYLTEGGDSDV